MAMYDVTPENMRGIANQIESLATDYENLYNNNLFQQLVGEDLAEAYKGTDAQALTNRLNNYRGAFNALKEQLIRYAEFLRSTAIGYENDSEMFAQQAANVGRNN